VKKVTEEAIVDDWLSFAASDLRSADLLYSGKQYPQALYYLQQSNEKLAKGLLISFGLLTPKAAQSDRLIKDVLGFTPKQPQAYRHKITPSFIADVEKTVPSIEKIYELIKETCVDPQFTKYKTTLKNSKKGLKKLRKKPYSLIEKEEQLTNEVKAANHLLFNLDPTLKKVDEDVDKLNFQEIVRAAHSIVGIPQTAETTSEYSKQKTKKKVLLSLNLSVLTTLSVALASFLDPLEAVTRYPDSSKKFDETNAYVKHFKEIFDLIVATLERGKMVNIEKSQMNKP
jgi:hypothetical protein